MIPAALDAAQRCSSTRVQCGWSASIAASRPATYLEVVPRSTLGSASQDRRIHIHARHFVLAAGAIGTPALLLRSHAPDPYAVLGRRTFLHPTAISAAVMADPVDAHAGAPQTIYSDHFGFAADRRPDRLARRRHRCIR
jgi:hypothetical protein